MSQFLLVDPGSSSSARLERIRDEFLQTVASHHFGGPVAAVLSGTGGRAEAIIDEAWDAQQQGIALEQTSLGQLARDLIRSGTKFVIWCGSDYRALPVVGSYSAFIEELRSQTAMQPADVYLGFVPAA